MSSAHTCILRSLLGRERQGAAVSPVSHGLCAAPGAPESCAGPARSSGCGRDPGLGSAALERKSENDFLPGSILVV